MNTMSYATGPIEQYLSDAASDKPAPGGGSVGALVGALASSMSEMAANFTVGKKKYADVEPQVRACLDRLEPCRRQLLALVDADVAAYEAVGAAYGMPKDSHEQRAARKQAIQQALRDAMEVPLSIMRQCVVVAEASLELVEIANRNLLTDVGVSAILAEAACAAARLNVEVNLNLIEDADVPKQVRPELDELTETTERCRREVARQVGQYLSQ